MTSPAPRPARVPAAGHDATPPLESRAGSPRRPYTVPHADVLAARLEVELSDDLGRPVPDWVVQVADARRDPQRPGEDLWIVGDVDDPDLSWSRLRHPEPRLYPRHEFWSGRPLWFRLVPPLAVVCFLVVVLALVYLESPSRFYAWVPGLLLLAALYAVALLLQKDRLRRAFAARREIEEREYRWRREQLIDGLSMPGAAAQRKRQPGGEGRAL